MTWRQAAVLSVVVALSTGVLAAQVKGEPEKKGPPYRMDVEDAPLEAVLENFLNEAAAWYNDEEFGDEIYAQFCKKYGIDSNWRSADRLGTAFLEIQTDFGKRVGQASKTLTFKDDSGQDPNDWRIESMGEAFAGIYEELRADGLEYDFTEFVELVESLSRHGFTSFSDEPFTEEQIARDAELFWQGAERVSAAAGQFYRSEVKR